MKNRKILKSSIVGSNLKIFVGTNTLTMIDQQAHACFNQMWYRLGKDFPQHQFFTMQPRRMSIDNMRNCAARTALELECDYLIFVDDDVLVEPKKVFHSLIEACEVHGKDIVMAETYIRGYPFEPMFFKHDTVNLKLDPYRDFEKHIDKKTGLVECDAVGFSCVIIRCSLIKQVSTPYFVTGVKGTEDIYFCMKARTELGVENVKIACDTKVPTGHLLDPEPLHRYNRKALIKYHETVYPFIKAQNEEFQDRGTGYAKEVHKTVKARKTEIKSRLRK